LIARWAPAHDEVDGQTRVLVRKTYTGLDGRPAVLEERVIDTFAADDPGWEIRFIVLRTSGSCRTGMEKSFQLDGNKVYWSHTGAEQQAWRCVTGPYGRQVRLVASSP